MWIWFFALIAGLLFLDLKVLNKTDHTISVKEALIQSAGWIGVSCAFGLWVFHSMGVEPGSQWFMAYIIEKSLSVDNLFVFLAIFTYFKVAGEYQHKVLYWGILGAMVLRAICIVGGVTLLSAFHPLMYVFGGILLATAWKVLGGGDDDSPDFDRTKWAQFLKKHFHFDLGDRPHSRGSFFTHLLIDEKVITYGTKLLFVLLILEFTDLLFATDSIPAALACSADPFVVYSSNIFAVLGLRSLYFALAAIMGKFQFLKYGISLVLALIGTKMILCDLFVLPMTVWLLAVALILSVSIAVSIAVPEEPETN